MDEQPDSGDDHDPLLKEVETLVRHGDMAVLLRHRETGIEVECATEATQIENRALALRWLRERLQNLAAPEDA